MFEKQCVLKSPVLLQHPLEKEVDEASNRKVDRRALLL